MKSKGTANNKYITKNFSYLTSERQNQKISHRKNPSTYMDLKKERPFSEALLQPPPRRLGR